MLLHSETIVSEFSSKMCWFNFIQFTAGYFNKSESFFNFKQIRWNYKTFIPTFFTFSNSLTKWIISLDKRFFYEKIFSLKVSWYFFEWWRSPLIIFHLKRFGVLEVHVEGSFVLFLIKVKFIDIIDVGEFRIQKLTRIYFYNKFNVWMIIV